MKNRQIREAYEASCILTNHAEWIEYLSQENAFVLWQLMRERDAVACGLTGLTERRIFDEIPKITLEMLIILQEGRAAMEQAEGPKEPIILFDEEPDTENDTVLE